MIEKIDYWVSIGLFSLMMTGSGMGFLSGSEQMVENLRLLGYPDYFRTPLGVAKLLGVVALLAPGAPVLLREWAYAGFAIMMVAAAISHLASGIRWAGLRPRWLRSRSSSPPGSSGARAGNTAASPALEGLHLLIRVRGDER